MHPKFIRKLLTRPIRWLETHRKYPIKQKVFSLPNITVNESPETVLMVLSPPQYLYDAAWAAYSLLRHLPAEIGLLLVIDGELPEEMAAKFSRLFAGILFETTQAIQERVRSSYPSIVSLGERIPVGRKLASILYFQQKYNLLYSDSDILCFAEMPEICHAVKTNEANLHMREEIETSIEPQILEEAYAQGLRRLPGLNSGFLYIRANSLKATLADKVLQTGRFDADSWWVEQTLMAILMHDAGSQPLPLARYTVSTQRQWYFQKDVDYDQIAIRHFISPIRHLMFLKGMPIIWRQINRGIVKLN